MNGCHEISIKRVYGVGQDAFYDLKVDGSVVKRAVPMDSVLNYLDSISEYTEQLEEMDGTTVQHSIRK